MITITICTTSELRLSLIFYYQKIVNEEHTRDLSLQRVGVKKHLEP